MKIAIIGAGNVGRALATSLTPRRPRRHDHRRPSRARRRGRRPRPARPRGSSNAAAAAGAQVVVLAVPAQALGQIAGDMGSSLDGKVVVDVSNRPTPTARRGRDLDRRGAPGHAARRPRRQGIQHAFASRQADPRSAASPPTASSPATTRPPSRPSSTSSSRSASGRSMPARSPARGTLEGMAWLNISANLPVARGRMRWVLVGPGRRRATAADSRN